MTKLPGGATIHHPAGSIDDHGSSITKKDNGDGTTTITRKAADEEGNKNIIANTVEGDVTIHPGGTVTVPPGGKVNGETYSEGATIMADGTIDGDPDQPEPEADVPAGGGDVGFGGSGAGTAAIAEQEVPLAGIVLAKDVLAELYKHAGSPDGEDGNVAMNCGEILEKFFSAL